MLSLPSPKVLDLGRARARARFVLGRDLTLGTVFDRLAEIHPDRVLVEEGDRPPLTVGEAAERVARWAGAIAATVDAGAVVVIATPNSYDQLLLCAAVCRAGAVAAPVNAQLRRDELDHVVADAGAGLVLRSPDDLPEAEPLAEPAPTSPTDLAALFYTSGTTGRPKGVEQTHRALLSGLGVAALLPAGDHVLGLFALPIAHVMGFLTALSMACAGVPARFLPRFRAAEVLDEIEARRVSIFVGVPAMYRMLLDAGAEGRDLQSVRLWISGADAMPADLAARFKRMGATANLPLVGPVGEATFAEGYGMVETGGRGAAKLSPPGFGRFLSDAVGVPMPGYRVRVVDEAGRPVPRGQVGELLLQGPGVTRGYHGDEEATSVAVVDGWLRTGDMARLGLFGLISFEGRKKDVIKSGGYSVYTVEVEQALEEHPDVVEAAVVPVPHPELGEVPGAVVRLAEGVELDPDSLKAFADARLSHYKVPRHFRAADELPRTATDKLRRAEVAEHFRDLGDPG